MRRLSLTLLLMGFAPVWAATETRIDAETGLATWQIERQGIQVRLSQISPDQARAFYEARGFSAAATEHYVAECVFMSVVRNIGDAAIAHRLADWRYTQPGQPPRRIRGKAEWDALWQRLGVDEAARVAFTWAQLPTEQTFEPGDWTQGMTTYRVAHDRPFDVEIRWRTRGLVRVATLNGVRCAR